MSIYVCMHIHCVCVSCHYVAGKRNRTRCPTDNKTLCWGLLGLPISCFSGCWQAGPFLSEDGSLSDF